MNPTTGTPATRRSARRLAALLVAGAAGVTVPSACGGSYPRFDADQNSPQLQGVSLAPAQRRAFGQPGPGCLFGWVEPTLPSPLVDAAAAAVAVTGVTAARLFDGPDAVTPARTTRYAALTTAGGTVLLADTANTARRVDAVPDSVAGCLAGSGT